MEQVRAGMLVLDRFVLFFSPFPIIRNSNAIVQNVFISLQT